MEPSNLRETIALHLKCNGFFNSADIFLIWNFELCTFCQRPSELPKLLLLFFSIYLISSLKVIKVKKVSQFGTWTSVLQHTSGVLYQLSYGDIKTLWVDNYLLKDMVNNCMNSIYIISKTMPQTSPQWLLFFNLHQLLALWFTEWVLSTKCRLNNFFSNSTSLYFINIVRFYFTVRVL